MKLFKSFFVFLFTLFFSGFFQTLQANVEDFTHDFSKGFVLYGHDTGTGEDITLQFGQALAEYLKWDSVLENFVLSDSLRVGGNIELTENKLIFDVDNTASGEDIEIVAEQGSDNDGVLRYNSSTNQWEISNDGGVFLPLGSSGSGLAPYIQSTSPTVIPPSTSITLSVIGGNFDYNTSVSIPSWEGSIDAVRYISNNQLEVDITSGSTETLYSIILENGALDSTNFQTDHGVDALEVATSNWVDLRSGGNSFTDGNGAGNDIRYRSGMTMSRDAAGMFFTGANPWQSWVKFESLGWNRGDNKTLEWIFTNPDAAMMIGIGSTATNEAATDQYRQAEVEAYFQNSTTMWGLYGNNGTPGGTGNQSSSVAISSCASQVFKAKFEGDGDNGDEFTLYCLPSAAFGSWDDESNVLTAFAIGGSLNPDESNIMPFIIPRSGGAQRFIALKVE